VNGRNHDRNRGFRDLVCGPPIPPPLWHARRNGGDSGSYDGSGSSDSTGHGSFSAVAVVPLVVLAQAVLGLYFDSSIVATAGRR
jgi:hypothetical protein